MRLDRIFEALDPRLAEPLRAELLRRGGAPPLASLGPGRWVLVGHRAAGKSRLMGPFGELAGLPAVDLDRLLEQRAQRSIREWVLTDEPGFRQAERALFVSRPDAEVNAVGGGFLSMHADLLAGHRPVLIPITFETYRERLLADRTRPRLRPALTLEEEILTVFQEREVAHARTRTLSLVDALLALTAKET